MKTVKTHYARIYISGPLAVIEQTCREYCAQGLCVTVTPTRFIYTGVEETGVVVELVNYPRFPDSPDTITNAAMELAEKIRAATFQHSYLVMTPTETHWQTTRNGGQGTP